MSQVPSWLTSLVVEIAAVTEDQRTEAEPEERVHETDHVIGTADEGLRNLWAVYDRYEKRGAEIYNALPPHVAADLASNEIGTKHADLVDELRSVTAKVMILNDILAESCYAVFPGLKDKSSFYVRRGWLVVWTDKQEEIVDVEVSLEFGPQTKQASKPRFH